MGTAVADMNQKSIRSPHKPYFLPMVRSLHPVDADGISEIGYPWYIAIVRIPRFLDSHPVSTS